MALVLSIKEGQEFYVGNTRYSVEALKSQGFTLRQHGGKDITFEVTCDQMIEIAPQIHIRAGLATHKGEASIDIQAPKDILILRDGVTNTRPNQ